MTGVVGRLRLLKGPLDGARAHTASLPCWYPSAGIDLKFPYRLQISVLIRHSPDLRYVYLPTHKAIQSILRPCLKAYYPPNMADEESSPVLSPRRPYRSDCVRKCDIRYQYDILTWLKRGGRISFILKAHNIQCTMRAKTERRKKENDQRRPEKKATSSRIVKVPGTGHHTGMLYDTFPEGQTRCYDTRKLIKP